jgi:hypothetical protein
VRAVVDDEVDRLLAEHLVGDLGEPGGVPLVDSAVHDDGVAEPRRVRYSAIEGCTCGRLSIATRRCGRAISAKSAALPPR